MSELVVIRHGQATLFAETYDQLSDLGIEQARRLGGHLVDRGLRYDEVYTGPARRQKHTAELVGAAYGTNGWPEPVVLDELDEHDSFAMMAAVVPGLRERDPTIRALVEQAEASQSQAEQGGRWQRVFENIMQKWLRGELDVEAETWAEFRDRVARGVRRILEGERSGRRVLAFTSVGPTAVILQLALGTSDERSFETAWRYRNSALSRFVFKGERLTLHEFNAVPHLDDPTMWTFR